MQGMGPAFALLAAFLLSPAELPKEMDSLFAEGKKWFQESGNTDLSIADRNAARVKAWKSLWPAKEALDLYEEENPAGMDAVDRKYGEVRMMVHWLKKEAPIGLLEGTGVGPAKGKGPAAEEEDPDPPPAPVPAPAKPAPAPTPETPKPAASPLAELYVAAVDWEKRHRTDVPGCYARWLKVVSASADPADPLARGAAMKAAELETRLKDAYKVLRDADPDALQSIDNVRMKGMAFCVAKDLPSPDPAVREQAAKTLGALRHPEGIRPLALALAKEPDGPPAEAMVRALESIGGAKGADALADLAADPRHASRALDALIRIASRNSVDRRTAAKQMGRFIAVKDGALFDRMVAAMKGLGYDGLIGLASALDNNSTYDRLLKVIDALSATKEPAVARVLARYFQDGRGARDGEVREAAMNAVRKMAKAENCGEAVVPHLFVGLRVPATRGYTTLLLQELTGKPFTVKEWGYWSDWWRSKHPGWSEKDAGKGR